MPGVNTGGVIVTLGEVTVGERLGTLGEGAVKLGWTATGVAGRGAIGAGSVGGVAVMLEKMRESDCKEKILSSPRVANMVGVGCKRAFASAWASAVAALVEMLDGTGQS